MEKSIDDTVADDHYSEKIVVKRSVIHIDNITHGHVNINMTSNAYLSPCDPRYGHELDPFIASPGVWSPRLSASSSG